MIICGSLVKIIACIANNINPFVIIRGTFITKPFTNFKKTTGYSSKYNKLLKHEESESHRKAKAFLYGRDDSLRHGTVFDQLHVASDFEKTRMIRTSGATGFTGFCLLMIKMIEKMKQKVL